MRAFLYFLFQKCFNASYSKQHVSDNDKIEEKFSMTFLDWLNVLAAASPVTNLNLRVHITSLLEMTGAIELLQTQLPLDHNHRKANVVSLFTFLARHRMKYCKIPKITPSMYKPLQI